MSSVPSDLYKTLESESDEQVYKEKGSKFLGYAYPISELADVEVYLNELRRKHAKARHWCYAWQLGVEDVSYRFSDDGEPNNSAGKPIYGQIQSFEVTNVLVVVVRYFGGTKLGVGGLVNAYRSAAKLSLQHSKIVQKMLLDTLALEFEYVDMNRVMRVIKEHQLDVVQQDMHLKCNIHIAIRKNKTEEIVNIFEQLRCLKLTRVS